jgi:hypothetical protein
MPGTEAPKTGRSRRAIWFLPALLVLLLLVALLILIDSGGLSVLGYRSF